MERKTESGKKRQSAGVRSSPLSKKLRIGDPDVTVIVQYTAQDGTREKLAYSLYSQQIAGLSNLFDTTLSVAMRESTTKEIHIEDVRPRVFERAIHF